jgi:ribosomal protein S12 methylthiotransferase accessory factor
VRELRARGLPALDPDRFDPPFGFTSSSWVAGYDVLAETACFVPRELVVSPGPFGPDTNGLAAGNLHVEAVLHALLEVIERDAATLRHVARWYGEDDAAIALRLVDPATLPPVADRWVAQLAAVGVSTTIEELTADTAVPVFRAVLCDTAFPGREGEAVLFAGLGADLDPVVAVLRAVSEAVQAHTGELVGARDAFEGDTARGPGRERALRWLSTRSRVVPFPSAAPPPDDVRGRLALVLDRLRAAGFTLCPVVDLTREDLGVPVVRVLLAGAAGPYPETARRPAARLLRALVC